jgi:hypothetical protein
MYKFFIHADNVDRIFLYIYRFGIIAALIGSMFLPSLMFLAVLLSIWFCDIKLDIMFEVILKKLDNKESISSE